MTMPVDSADPPSATPPAPASDALRESYRYCHALTRRTAGNFYYSFLTLPQERLQAMCALYAFMRITDDLGDNPGTVEARAADLRNWRESLNAALAGTRIDHPLFPALVDMLQRYRVPAKYLEDVIAGVEMDLVPARFETFAELERYCYHVAGAVGLACIHLWGFHDQRALVAAVDCGLAFQLTNILRDLKEDALVGRIYLPAEDLRTFEYPAENLANGSFTPEFERLMRFQVDRAQGYYDRAHPLLKWLDPAGQPILEAMLSIYGGLLHEIRRRNYDVYTRRVQLSRWWKLSIAAKAIARQQWKRLFGGRH